MTANYGTLVMDKAREMISECASFQTRCGVATAAAALPFIHDYHAPPGVGPIVIIEEPEVSYRQLASNTMWPGCTLTLRICDYERKPGCDESHRDFSNFCNTLISELAALAQQDDNLDIEAFDVVVKPSATQEERRGSERILLAAEYSLTIDKS